MEINFDEKWKNRKMEIISNLQQFYMNKALISRIETILLAQT